MAKRDAEEQFEDIIQRAVEEMERVKCPIADYAAGLRSARERFADMHAMVLKEMARHD